MESREKKPYLLSANDIIIFHADNQKYMLYAPQNVIFKIDNPYFDKFINASLGVGKSSISSDLGQEIHDYFIETSNKLGLTPKAEDIDEINYFKPSCVVLNIAGRCNLLCNYCFARSSTGFVFEDMSVETAMKAIAFMIRVNPDSDQYTITFFGGEPFLKINSIIEVIEKVLLTYPQKKFAFTATTNGTILTKKILNIIKKYNISLIVSIDGPEEITNRNRPHKDPNINTFNKIIQNIQILKNENVDFELRSTVIAAGEYTLVEYAQFFENLGIGYHLVFCFDTASADNSNSNWDGENLTRLTISFKDLMDYYYNKIKKKEKIHAHFLLENLRNIAIRQRNYVPCGSGVNMFAVNSDETIYSCMNFSPLLETTIGTLNIGVDKEKNSLYKTKYIDNTMCKDCNIRYLCGGGCVAERYVNFKDTDIVNVKYCNMQRIIIDNYLTLFQRIKNINPLLIENIANHQLKYEDC